VRNYNVGVRETDGHVLFLYRLQPGGADRSYGIEVGRLAGLPEQLLSRAREVLRLLEGEQLAAALASGRETGRARPVRGAPADAQQLTFFAPAPPHPVIARLAALDANDMTPLQALQLLAELAAEAREGGRPT
jgi:DNA mismatch repair protein MutS